MILFTDFFTRLREKYGFSCESDLKSIADMIITEIYDKPLYGEKGPLGNCIGSVLSTSEDTLCKVNGYTFHRAIHGGMHVTRAMMWTKLIAKLYGHLGESLPEDDLKLVLIAVLMHDSGREGKGVDHWDRDSAVNCYHLLHTTLGVPSYKAAEVASAIFNKDNSPKQYEKLVDFGQYGGLKWIKAPKFKKPLMCQLVQVGDQIDIIRACYSIVVQRSDFWKIMIKKAPYMRDFFIEFVNQARDIIASQGDQRREMNFERKAVFHTDPRGCFAAVCEDILTNPLMYVLMSEGYRVASQLPPILAQAENVIDPDSVYVHAFANVFAEDKKGGNPLPYVAEKFQRGEVLELPSVSSGVGATAAPVGIVITGIQDQDCVAISDTNIGCGHHDRTSHSKADIIQVKMDETPGRFMTKLSRLIQHLEEGVDNDMVRQGRPNSEVILKALSALKVVGISYSLDHPNLFGLARNQVFAAALLVQHVFKQYGFEYPLIRHDHEARKFTYVKCPDMLTVFKEVIANEVYRTPALLTRTPIKLLRSVFKQTRSRTSVNALTCIERLLSPAALDELAKFITSLSMGYVTPLVMGLNSPEAWLELLVSTSFYGMSELLAMPGYELHQAYCLKQLGVLESYVNAPYYEQKNSLLLLGFLESIDWLHNDLPSMLSESKKQLNKEMVRFVKAVVRSAPPGPLLSKFTGDCRTNLKMCLLSLVGRGAMDWSSFIQEQKARQKVAPRDQLCFYGSLGSVGDREVELS